MFPHQRKATLQQAFDAFSASVIASGQETLRQWLVELSTCIILGYEWEEKHFSTKMDVIRRLSMASMRMKRELERTGVRIRLPEELALFANGAPPAGSMLNIYCQTAARANKNIQDCGARYPEDRRHQAFTTR